jgi:hypothetical protein
MVIVASPVRRPPRCRAHSARQHRGQKVTADCPKLHAGCALPSDPVRQFRPAGPPLIAMARASLAAPTIAIGTDAIPAIAKLGFGLIERRSAPVRHNTQAGAAEGERHVPEIKIRHHRGCARITPRAWPATALATYGLPPAEAC